MRDAFGVERDPQEISKGNLWEPVSRVGQMLRNRGAVKAGGAIAAPNRSQTSAAKVASRRQNPVFNQAAPSRSNTPTTAPSVHTAAASPVAGGGKTVSVGAQAKPPATPKANKPPKAGGGKKKNASASAFGNAIKNPWVIGGATAAGAGVVGTGAYMAGRNR
jgi:hypothetical protein